MGCKSSSLSYPDSDGVTTFQEQMKVMDPYGMRVAINTWHTSFFGRAPRIEYGASMRPTIKNQDRVAALPGSAESPQQPVLASFGVFDGHGMTASSAEVCREHILIASLSRQQFADVGGEGEGESKGAEPRGISMDRAIRAEQERSLSDAQLALPSDRDLYAAYRWINQRIQKEYPWERSGSTATTTFASHDPVLDVWHLKCAWVGDSRAMVVHADGHAQAVTVDHQLGNPEERERIMTESQTDLFPNGTPKSFIAHRVSKKGAKGPEAVFSGKGTVSHLVTRTLGDPHAAPAVSNEPEVVTLTVAACSRLVLASDGMWDVMTEADVAKAIKGVDDPHIAARKLSKLAHGLRITNMNSSDDITVLVVNLKSCPIPHETQKGLVFGRPRTRSRTQSPPASPARLQTSAPTPSGGSRTIVPGSPAQSPAQGNSPAYMPAQTTPVQASRGTPVAPATETASTRPSYRSPLEKELSDMKSTLTSPAQPAT